MKCPRTGSDLRKVKVGGIEVDVSDACGGVFFDNHELKKFDEQHEKRGEVLSAYLGQLSTGIDNPYSRINCPRCVSVVMMRRYANPRRILEIDVCPTCGGIWLDPDELEALRRQFPSGKEREEMIEKLISEAEEHPDVVADRAELNQAVGRMRKLSATFWRVIGG